MINFQFYYFTRGQTVQWELPQKRKKKILISIPVVTYLPLISCHSWPKGPIRIVTKKNKKIKYPMRVDIGTSYYLLSRYLLLLVDELRSNSFENCEGTCVPLHVHWFFQISMCKVLIFTCISLPCLVSINRDLWKKNMIYTNFFQLFI